MTLHRPARILVIDDEPSIVRALARLLQREGYTVETAGNGRQALALLQAHGYDVLLVDLRMPELDGQAFYALLRHQYPALRQRVIFLTGVSDEADSAAFLHAVWPTLVTQALPHGGAPPRHWAGAAERRACAVSDR